MKTNLIVLLLKSAKTPVKVDLAIAGLPESDAEQKHGLHIHTNGITIALDNNTGGSNDNLFHWKFWIKKTRFFFKECGSTGVHFNPTNQLHGDRTSLQKHIGDLGNVIANRDGSITSQFTDNQIQLFGQFSIIGRAIVLHSNEDGW
jgi:Cu/Zn superoxide dismutase